MPSIKPIHIYTECDLQELSSNPNGNELLKVLMDKSNQEKVADLAHHLSEDYAISNNINDCDIVFLPHSYQYYVINNLTSQLLHFQKIARDAGKPLLIINHSDFPANLPSHEGIILCESSAYRSRGLNQGKGITYGLPSFIDDYAHMYNDGAITCREKGKKPVVGFCGQGGGSLFDYSRRYLTNLYHRVSYHSGKRSLEPAPFETTYLRHKILTRLSSSPLVETNFIIRQRYRAGVAKSERTPFHITRLDFVNNILNTDYTVCIRGGGNFSVRFYETLCLGRIPIFIDTDCVLPFDVEIDYRKYCVWVEESEIPYIVEKVVDFHSSKSSDDFRAIQHQCRGLWTEYLSFIGYYQKLATEIKNFKYLLNMPHESLSS